MEASEELKTKGNESFRSGQFSAALDFYSAAIKASTAPELQSSLYCNMGACHLKLKALEECVQACTKALELNTSFPKALYRRSSAHFQLGHLKEAMSDLKRLLQLDVTNKEGLDLMRQVRSRVEHEQAGKSEIQNCLKALQEPSPPRKKVQEILRVVISLCVDDQSHASEFLRSGGLAVLSRILTLSKKSLEEDADTVSQVLMTISSVANHKVFSSQYLSFPSHGIDDSTVRVVELRADGRLDEERQLVDDDDDEDDDDDDFGFLSKKSGKVKLAALCKLIGHEGVEASVTQAAVCLVMRILKSLPLERAVEAQRTARENKGQTSEQQEPEEAEPFLPAAAWRVILTAFVRGLRSTVDVPETFSLVSDALSSFVGELGDYLTPEKMIDERNESLEERKARMRRLRCLRRRSKMHALAAMEIGALDVLVEILGGDSKTIPGNAMIKARSVACFGRMVLAVQDDEAVKAHFAGKSYFAGSSADQPTLVSEARLRAALTAALYIPRPELGAWALAVNETGPKELMTLIGTMDQVCQDLAAEVMCLAAASENGSSQLAPLVDRGALRMLLQSPNSSTRAAAASTLTKLSIKAKALEEDSAEVAQVLNTAFDVLRVAISSGSSGDGVGGSATPAGAVGAQQLVSFSVFDVAANSAVATTATAAAAQQLTPTSAPTTVERAVEIVASMIGRTHVKEEVVHGSFRVSQSSIKTLISVAETLDERSTAAYGIAHIVAALTVTNAELHAKALSERDMTPEQYEQLQELQRIKTTDEKTGEKIEERKEERDKDTAEMCHLRIKRLCCGGVGEGEFSPGGVIPLLCRFVTKGSDQTKEAAARALRQVCVEESVRGLVVQQGGLKACCTVAMDNTVQPPTRREAAHAVAKTLVTTNPHLFSEHQRLGTVQPLLMLCRDVDATNLQQFEALLSLTNICSCGVVEQEKFVAEKGIPAVHYLIFSDHRMVRRAACEVFCNLPLHEAVLKLLRQPDKLRLWLGLCEDWDCDVAEGGGGGENQKQMHLQQQHQGILTARAVAGTLAVAAEDKQVCDALVAEKCATSILKLFESENPELIHRALVMTQQLAEIGGKAAAEHLIANNMLPALTVVANLVPSLASLSRDVAKAISALL